MDIPGPHSHSKPGNHSHKAFESALPSAIIKTTCYVVSLGEYII